MTALERAPSDPAEPDDREFFLTALWNDFSLPIPLVDSLYIDRGTMEYTVNDGPWQFAHDVASGATDYPVAVDLQEDELHGLYPIIQELERIGIDARAYRVMESWQIEAANTAAAPAAPPTM